MKYEKYQLEADKKLLLFEFVSVGPKGRITKLVQYTPTNLKNYFNLGFGDKMENTEGIDDLSISNNGDSHQVLATVASTIYIYQKEGRSYPVPFHGSKEMGKGIESKIKKEMNLK